MGLLRCKSRTFMDFYEFYPYRKNPSFSATIPVPYVKKELVSDHKYSLTYKEYLAIMLDIVDLIIERLIIGEKWTIGSAIGELQLVKKKCKTFVDRIKSGKEGKVVKSSRNGYDNYMIFAEWERLYFPVQNKWLWRFKILPAILRGIYLKSDTDYTYIYKFRDK